MTFDRNSSFALEFRELHDHLHGAGDAADAMQRLVDLAHEAVPGCESAAMTQWFIGQRPHLRSYAGDLGVAADHLQYELGEGPCLTAALDGEPVHAPDLSTETRWPAFCAAAVSETSVRGVMSFRLTGGPELLALNLYATEAGAFDGAAFTDGALFAVHAGALAAHAVSAAATANLQAALTTSRQIGTAIGILMFAHKVPEDQAFEMLRTRSQHLNRKLRDIAATVAETGRLP